MEIQFHFFLNPDSIKFHQLSKTPRMINWSYCFVEIYHADDISYLLGDRYA